MLQLLPLGVISVLSGGSDLVYIEGPITVLIDRMTYDLMPVPSADSCWGQIH